jgi:CRISPR-associated protein Cmr3
MKQLFMQPVDTFFFRNQKDFTPGVNSMAASVFPPRPGTVYGALRSAYINQYSTFEQFRTGCEGQVKEWMGTPVEPGRFRLRGCFLHDQQQPILPLPLDYQVVETEHTGEAAEIAYPLKLTLDVVPASDGRQYRLYGVRDEKSGSSAGAYLPLSDWKKALLEPSSVHIYRSSHWMIQEDKLGIARDWATRTAREGMLYQIKTNRFIEAKEPARSPGLLAVCTDAPDFSEISLVRLGGRNRPWALKSIPDEFGMFKAKEERLIEERIASSQIARLILLTPAIWRKIRRSINSKLEFFNCGRASPSLFWPKQSAGQYWSGDGTLSGMRRNQGFRRSQPARFSICEYRKNRPQLWSKA